jgi:hypothetical protein
MVQAGIEVNKSNASDLYVEDCPESRAILANHGKEVDGHNVHRFKSHDDKYWMSIPFQFMGDR